MSGRVFSALARAACDYSTTSGLIKGRKLHRRSLQTTAIEDGEKCIASTSQIDAIPRRSHLKERIRTQIRNRDQHVSPPASPFLTDKHHRRHSYLRISLTERCNLRCMYCMPEEGVPLMPKDSLLSSPEIARLARLFVSEGVNKIRLTGGEPTLRKDLPDLIGQLSDLRSLGLKQVGMTTNGLTLSRQLSSLVSNGLTHLNISLDTLDPFKFELMTRRPSSGLEKVLRGVDAALSTGVAHVKINVVVIRGLNDTEDVLKFVEWAKFRNVVVRFIEYMPFDGNRWKPEKLVPFQALLDTISNRFGPLERLVDDANDTSKHWRVPGHIGKLGFITSMTDHFCGTCNRLRITADGNLKVCLFGNAEVSLRDAMRSGLIEQGSLPATDQQLLEIIGAAVGRKHAKHAGMADLNALATGGQEAIRLKIQVPLRQRRIRRPLFYTPMSTHLLSSHQRLYSTGGRLQKNHKDKVMQGSNENSTQEHQTWSKYMGTDTEGDDSPWASLDAFADGAKHQAPSHATPKLSQESWEDSAIAAAEQFASSSLPPVQSTHSSRATESSPTSSRLSHLDEEGQRASMVDVSSKETTIRTATAEGRVYINETAYRLLQRQVNEGSNALKVQSKGPVLQVSQLAGIMGAKKTSELIPLCHGLHLSHVDVTLQLLQSQDDKSKIVNQEGSQSFNGGFSLEELDEGMLPELKDDLRSQDYFILVTCTTKTSSQTGVEMEALTGVSIACLTVWDMLKSVAGREMRIYGLMVTSKQGGKSGDWRRD